MRRKFLTIAAIGMMTLSSAVPALANSRVSNLKVIDLENYHFNGPSAGTQDTGNEPVTEETVLMSMDADVAVAQDITAELPVYMPAAEVPAIGLEANVENEPVVDAIESVLVDVAADENSTEMTASGNNKNDSGTNTEGVPEDVSADEATNEIAEKTAETSFPDSESIPDILAALNIDADEIDTAMRAIASAFKKIGVPYSQAKRDSGTAYDCSSMVYYSYKDAGINLGYNGSNTAASICQGLVKNGKEVTLNELEAGDLLFYAKKKDNGRFRRINHVAMYIGNGQIIHASSSKGRVVKSNLYTSGLASVCRPFM